MGCFGSKYLRRFWTSTSVSYFPHMRKLAPALSCQSEPCAVAAWESDDDGKTQVLLSFDCIFFFSSEIFVYGLFFAPMVNCKLSHELFQNSHKCIFCV